MKLVPNDLIFSGSPMALRNGAPARARDAYEADRLETALGAGRRTHPVIIGTGMASGVTWEFRTLLPAFCNYVAISYLVSGRGTITTTCNEDTYNSVAEVEMPGTTAATAEWVHIDDPQTVGANGYRRCLQPADQADPHEVEINMTLTNAGGSTITVWQVLVRPLPRVAALP